jgi:hypothetical protein
MDYKLILHLPLMFINWLFSFVFDYIPQLNFKYKEQAGRLDSGAGLTFHELHTKSDRFGNPMFKKLKIKDITNRKLRRSLRLSTIFRKWNIYQLDQSENRNCNVSDDKRYRIYITKDILEFDSLVTGERISDFKLSKNYSRKKERLYLKSKGVTSKEFYKLEPQLYVICALKSKRHEKQSEKRKIKYAKDKYNKLTKQVKKAIKDDRLYSRVGSWDDQTPLNLAIQNDRYDLIEKILKYTGKIDEVDKVLNYVHRDWDDYPKEYKPLDMAKTDKMKAYLTEKGSR